MIVIIITNGLPKIDLGLGCNPFGFSKKIKRLKLKTIDLNSYPIAPEKRLRQAIVNFFKEKGISLQENSLAFGFGSMDCLQKIVGLIIGRNDLAIGMVPQFPDFEDEINLNQGMFKGLPMKNFAFDEECLLAEKGNLVFIDNPNNPTGQIIPLKRIRRLAEKSKAIIIVDEAYGEFMPLENSTANIVEEFDNVICVKSFSKGFGLAGIRLGFAIANQQLIKELSKLMQPFQLNAVSAEIALMALQDREFIQASTNKTIKLKKKLIKELAAAGLQTMKTSPSTPIMLCRKPNSNLFQELKERDIIAEPGSAFRSLNQEFVRIRIPKNSKTVEEVKERLISKAPQKN